MIDLKKALKNTLLKKKFAKTLEEIKEEDEKLDAICLVASWFEDDKTLDEMEEIINSFN